MTPRTARDAQRDALLRRADAQLRGADRAVIEPVLLRLSRAQAQALAALLDAERLSGHRRGVTQCLVLSSEVRS